MDWWNDLLDWTSSDTGWRVISGALIPFVAIVVAGVVAALIGRGATKRVVSLQEREAKNAAVAAIISAARKAASWGSLGHEERGYADHLAEDADIRLRLLPINGAPLAANWAQHEIADIKKNSSTFSFQAEQSLAEFRDRLLEWQSRPGKARKLFKYDLERWKFESPDPDADLIKRQQDWSADQASGKRAPEPTPAPTPTTTSLRPAPQRTGGPTTPAAQPASATAAGSTAAGTGAGIAAAGTPGTAASADAVAGYTATRGTDPNATTPITDGATRSFGDGLTRPYGDDQPAPTPIRPALGTPGTPGAPGTSASPSRGSSDVDADNADVVDEQPVSSPRPQSSPRETDTQRDAGTLTDGPVDAAGPTNTTSIPTRIADAPVEPADADETSEAPYTQPISANELRRRAEDDE
ncbi:hypothetical protein GA0004736_1642 [Curtobacterium sp. 9128]|uniref:hypothetical protein n=1 Tax=Curtobacterium sp. 9128 TaxID=1793722 RepID=UPI0007D73199|nr:hypothetical protein [Curtobacterium sp. 9128]SBN62734.1 hypothetical protein GA0004736_1642 [Curtobacterium sp. 9128]